MKFVLDFKLVNWKTLLVFAIAITAAILSGIAVMSSDTDNSTVDWPAVVKNGVETVPAEVDVEASWSKIWHDGRPSEFWIVVAILIGALGPAAFAFARYGSTDGPQDIKFVGVLLLCWAGSLIITFSGTSKIYGSSSYQARISKAKYEELKAAGKLDTLFPNVETGADD